ncbi:MAG TPA: MOSC domain-containing protein [Myxococcales bacterium]|mgnify:CR=1 FL=1|nr:MOSC domain-containing protein [Myxococcales bacterium]
MLSIEQLLIYPVKSCAAVSVQQMPLNPSGPADDRRWMWVGPAGRFLSQRDDPRLVHIRPRLSPDSLTLEAPGVEPLRVVRGQGSYRSVSVWGQACQGRDAGEVARQWISRLFGIEASLVEQSEPRLIEDDPGQGHSVSFADGYPLLVCTKASVSAVSKAVDGGASALRFRPNVVIGGAQPFEEDHWTELQSGDAVLSLVKPCARCTVVDVDPDSAVRRTGVLRQLAASRRIDGELRFGINAVVTQIGSLKIGDLVQVQRRQS